MKVTSVRGPQSLACIIVLSCFLLPVTSSARNTATAVLTNGHSITLEVGQKLPWTYDITRHTKPLYPADARAKGYQGSGVIRLTLDPKTGVVTSAIVRQSTGYKVLDQSALEAVRGWRWKPGKWQQVDVPVTFRMTPAR
jgi:TonB family protein